MSLSSRVHRKSRKYTINKETNKGFSVRRSHVSVTTESLYKSNSDVVDEIFSRDDEDDDDMYIQWNRVDDIKDLRRVPNVLYNEELIKLDNSPLPFHSNFEAKRAFLPDAVREHIFFEQSRIQNRKPTYTSRFSEIFIPQDLTETSPVVRQGLGVVLFIDVSGFTKLGHKYGEEHAGSPKKAADCLSSDIIPVINDLTRICYENKGSVAKFAGDALICVWECDFHDFGKSKDLKKPSRISRNVDLKTLLARTKAMIDNFLEMAKQASREMVAAASERSNGSLTLHGGIGVGNLIHLYLGTSKKRNDFTDYNPDGLMWYLINGFAVKCATELMETVKPGIAKGPNQIWYLKSYKHWIDAFILKRFFYDFDSALNSHNFDREGYSTGTPEEIFSSLMEVSNRELVNLEVKSRVFAKENNFPWVAKNQLRMMRLLKAEASFDDFLPRHLKLKLQGNSILGNEVLEGVSIVFVKLDDKLIKTESFLNLPVLYEAGQYTLEKDFRDSLNYLNRTFIALSNSVKKAGGEVRDLIFDDKGCVFICAFSAHKFVSHSEFRAVAAAIDIVKAHENAKIGISSGSFFVGLCGIPKRHDFIIMGNDVNFAAGMMSKSENGKIYVSPIVRNKLESSSKVHFRLVEYTGKSGKRPCYTIVDIPETQVLHDLPPNFFPVCFNEKEFKELLQKSVEEISPENYSEYENKLKELSNFAPYVNQADNVERAHRSLSHMDHVFIHGKLGYGKKLFLDSLKKRLKNDVVKYKVFSVSCSDLETNKHFSTIRKIIKIILDSELKFKRHTTGQVTKFSKRLKVNELNEILEIFEDKGQISNQEVIKILPYLLPHLKSTEVLKLTRRSPSKHLASLQSLLTVQPPEEILRECQKFFADFIKVLASGLLKPTNKEPKKVSRRRRKSSKSSRNKNSATSIIILKKTLKRSPTGHSTRSRKSRRKEIVQVEEPIVQDDFVYVLMFDNFDEISSVCRDTIEGLFSSLPENVRLVFSMGRIPRIPVRSGYIETHQEYLDTHLGFRKSLEKSSRRLDDIYLEKLSIEEGKICAERTCFQLCFTNFHKLRVPFLKHYFANIDKKISSKEFIIEALQFYFDAVGVPFDETTFAAVARNSKGHPGRIASLVLSFVYNELLQVERTATLENELPLPLVGDVRTLLDILPGVCVWTLKILAAVGQSIPFKTAYELCRQMSIIDSAPSMPLKRNSRVKKVSMPNLGEDFKRLFIHTISMLLNYKVLIEEKDQPSPRNSHSDNKSQISRYSGRASRNFMQEIRKPSRIGSFSRQSSFDIRKTRVSSMFFSSSRLSFTSQVESNFLSASTPQKRALQIRECLKKQQQV